MDIMEPFFMGQIEPWSGTRVPKGWMLCNGDLLDIASHSALFSILGTYYGGDGRITFGLPKLRGRVVVHTGQDQPPNLQPKHLGEMGGVETREMSVSNMPAHTHNLTFQENPPFALMGTTEEADLTLPDGASLADASDVEPYSENTPGTPLAKNAAFVEAQGEVGFTGGGQAFTNEQPYLVVNYLIAIEGPYPSRA